MRIPVIELPNLLRAIDERKAALDALRPLSSATAASLRAALSLEWTYHSNAIEGNTLTLRETRVVLEGITVGGKSLRDHLEAVNHRDAILLVEDLVARSAEIDEWNIRGMHQLLLRTIDPVEAGRYRRENVLIAGASFQPPSHILIPERMQDLATWHQTDAQHLHPIARAAELHTRFVEIHPFVDGNGRTGRLLLNLDLMRAGFPPAVIRKEDRTAYYDALDKACTTRDYEDITRLVADGVIRTLDLYLETATGQKPTPLIASSSDSTGISRPPGDG
jgi:Fic family protein